MADPGSFLGDRGVDDRILTAKRAGTRPAPFAPCSYVAAPSRIRAKRSPRYSIVSVTVKVFSGATLSHGRA